MSGHLYIVATPIGNLDDITLRAIETLREVDLIAAEDTRHSKQLLNHLAINKPMLSLHEHNERERIDSLLRKLLDGQNVALISDAGTPLISDPGYPLVSAAAQQGIRVVPVPGASSIITALSAAGVPTDRFCFHGFLPPKGSERVQRLEQLASIGGTHVLLESTHRIINLLQLIEQELSESEVVVAKELTKRFENFIRGSASDCLQEIERDSGLQKGEFVVLLNIAERQNQSELDAQGEVLLRRLLGEVSVKTAAKIVVDIHGGKKNSWYQRALEIGAEK